VREDTKNILAVVRLARRAAVEGQEIMVLVVDANEGSFSIKNFNGFINSRGMINNFLVPRQLLGKGVKLVRLEGFEQIGNKEGLIFWPDGRTKEARIELAVDEDGKSGKWHILIDDYGRAVIEEAFKNE